MDEQVIAAMARWPDVPDVYGWLSLSERGEWRLHPQGDALLPDHCAPDALSPGEAITSPAILRFMNRNYAYDNAGQWYFQNGPQKVYVRLDAAPHVLHTMNEDTGHRLRSHTGLDIRIISGWWLDDKGKLYAQTDIGSGLIAGRDLPTLLAELLLEDGTSLLDALEHDLGERQLIRWGKQDSAVPLNFCLAASIENKLGFVRCPALGRITS
ncbi:DUF2946 family protein [Pollutimonas harenae]|uniref:DUF2946 family protein n=1 Tax=Pollutimonas harenae TaxID=657015 RepID=A0A853GQN2_9BURK|nr:DUF2946 family protein [Pollutimonas harenae]NYT85368.1 DUF2946 family protein [Pollutimonas harenae]TEA70469.1 DUF2946 family protein [Pollutimonas harenae]